jgi:hypothetical protein
MGRRIRVLAVVSQGAEKLGMFSSDNVSFAESSQQNIVVE